MKVNSILRSKGHKVVGIKPDATVLAATQTLKRQSIGAVIVSELGDGVDGILSERDIVYALADRGVEVLDLAVSELMTTQVMCCVPDDDLDKVMDVMTSQRIRHLPVKDDDKLVGIVSIGDLVKYRLDELQSERDSLKEYIAQ